jgi:hypothetical protein
MAFDKTLPTNATKIRNYPTVLTDNFSAIEEGDITLKYWQVNFIERNSVPGAPPPTNDPTRADNTMILFSKQDGAGETELWILDDRSPANNYQITEAGKLGSQNTQFVTQDISFGTETSTYSSTNMIAYWAIISSGGAVVASSGGITAVRNSTGRYTVTFTTPQSTVNYGVNVTCENTSTGDNPHICNYFSKNINNFQVLIKNQNGTSVDRAFTITIYGGRS